MFSQLKKNDQNETYSAPSNLLIYCTRPGARIWKASTTDGRVLNTLQYKECLSGSSEIEKDLTQQDISSKSKNFDNARFIREKTIAHNFSLVYKQRVEYNDNTRHSASDILITFNSIGIYLISLDDLTNVNFIRLSKKGGSISNIVLDLDLEYANHETKENDRNHNENEIENGLRREVRELKPFPVYVSNFNGFVERHMIQPHISEDNACEKNNGKIDKDVRTKDWPVKVCSYFLMFNNNIEGFDPSPGYSNTRIFIRNFGIYKKKVLIT